MVPTKYRQHSDAIVENNEFNLADLIPLIQRNGESNQKQDTTPSNNLQPES
jgi:hypothetical protein